METFNLHLWLDLIQEKLKTTFADTIISTINTIPSNIIFLYSLSYILVIKEEIVII